MMRKLFHVLHRDTVSGNIAADLGNFRNEPVHKIAGEKHEPVHGVAVDALAAGFKAADDPVVERRAGLRRKVYGLACGFELLDKRQPPVRLRARRERDDNGAPVRNVREKRRRALVAALVHIKSAQLHKRPLSEERHSVERFGDIVRRGRGGIHALCVELVLRRADTRSAQARNEVREKIVLLAPEKIELFRAFVAEVFYKRAVVERRFLFAEGRFCHSVLPFPGGDGDLTVGIRAQHGDVIFCQPVENLLRRMAVRIIPNGNDCRFRRDRFQKLSAG